jgi:hypothetical protein
MEYLSPDRCAGNLILRMEVILPDVMFSAACRGNRSVEVEYPSGAAEKVLSFSPELCPPSSRDGVQNPPGILFSFVPESCSGSAGFPRKVRTSSGCT